MRWASWGRFAAAVVMEIIVNLCGLGGLLGGIGILYRSERRIEPCILMMAKIRYENEVTK